MIISYAKLYPYCVDPIATFPRVKLRDGRVLRLRRDNSTAYVMDGEAETITFLSPGGEC